MIGTPKIEPGRLSDWLLYEENGIGSFSRDIVTVAANQTLKCGSPVAYNEAGTQVVEYDNTDPDGEVVVGILTEDVTTGATPVKSTIVARQARIAPSGLVWKTGMLDADKNAGLADLRALGIIPVPSEV